MRVLQVIPDLSISNGAMSMIMNYQRAMSADVQFDYLYFLDTQADRRAEIEALGNVKIALVPVGGSFASEKLSEVISLLEPNIIIPMMYQTPAATSKLKPLNEFLKTMGVDKQPEIQPSFQIKSGGSLPEETRVIVLDYQRN